MSAKKPRLTTLKPRVAELNTQRTKVLTSWRSGMTTAERGYGGRWQRMRDLFLRSNPLCKFCSDAGRVTAASVVDHRVPHEGDEERMWDESNWQPLCATCHSSIKQSIERSGRVQSL